MSLSKRNRRWILGLGVPVVLTCAAGVLFLAQGQHQSASATAQSTISNPALANPLSTSELFDQRYGRQRGVSQASETEVVHAKRGQLTLRFRAIGLNREAGDVTADQTLAREVLRQIQSGSLFEPGTDFSGKLSDEESPGTFTFTIAAKLKRPQEL